MAIKFMNEVQCNQKSSDSLFGSAGGALLCTDSSINSFVCVPQILIAEF